LHVIRAAAIVVQGVKIHGDMGIVFQIRKGDGNEALLTRHGWVRAYVARKRVEEEEEEERKRRGRGEEKKRKWRS